MAEPWLAKPWLVVYLRLKIEQAERDLARLRAELLVAEVAESKRAKEAR